MAKQIIVKTAKATLIKNLAEAIHEITVPTYELTVQVSYKGAFLPNCTILFFSLDESLYSGDIPLPDATGTKIRISGSKTDHNFIRLNRKHLATDHDLTLPVLGNDYFYGPINENALVKIIVVDAKPR